MKQNLFKKGWLLLGVILCVGIGAWAVGEASGEAVTDPVATVNGTGYATLDEALGEAGSGSTVQLQKDVVATKLLYITKPLTLDLNGKTISGTVNNNFKTIFTINTNGAVTISDTKGNGGIKFTTDDFKGPFAVIDMKKGVLNLKGGTISAINSTSAKGYGHPNALQMWASNTDEIEVNIDGAHLYAEGGEAAQAIITDWASPATTNFSKLNIKSGSITAKGVIAWGITGNTTLNMTGGTITADGVDEVYGIYFPIGNTYQKMHNISGGTIIVNATQSSSTYDVLHGPVYISGGKFFLNGNGTSNVFSQNKNDKTNRYYRLDIIGGYFNKPVADAYLNKEVRLVDVDANSAEGKEGLKYKVERAKFHVDVTGYNPVAEEDGYRDPVAVNANVFKDYSFRVRMPEANEATVGADKADVNIAMTGVQTLGLKEGETRTYSKTVETGVQSDQGYPLTDFLSNVYHFNKVDVPVTITDGKETYKFTYNIGAYGETYANTILGTPSSETDARAAWHLLTSKVKASQDLTTNDTHFLFKRGAYILIGDEKLVFDQDYDFLKGNANLSTLFSDVRPYVHVEKSGLSGQAANKAVIYMPEGSTLGISSSSAALTEDAFLTVDATDKPDLNVTGKLSGLRDLLLNTGDNASKVAIAYAVVMFNQIVGLVDDADNVPVTLEFKKNKFHLDVTGYSSDEDNAVPVTVNANVFSDYSFDVALPAPGSDQLTASKATVNIRMTDVSTLGVSGTRSYSKTVNTGVTGVTANLSGALEKTYKFNGASCPVTIKADGQEKSFTYNIAGITADEHIVGTPDNSKDAQAAWALMTSKVTTQSGVTPDDTHFLFKKGAYLQIGDERLVFLKDFDFLKGSASMANLFDGAQTRIEKANISGAKTIKAVVYLPAGSTLGISQSNASVTEDVKITMSAFDEVAQQFESSGQSLTGLFTYLKSSTSDLNAKTAIAALVYVFDGVVGLVDTTDGAQFTVEFTQPKPVKFHVDVTGYDADTNDPIAVNADVFNDYSFKVSLPDPLNDNLSASKATVNISMTGVQTLGLKEGETRSYTKTVNTGVDGISAKLSGYLTNTYKFDGVTIPVTVREKGTTGESFIYNIAGIDEDYNIVGTPDNEDKARAAWHLLTSKVSASQDLNVNDTHFLFKKGAYLQIGDEKLVFLKDFDFLKGAATVENLFSDAEGNVQIQHAASAASTAQVYLPAGSTLGVSSSAASLSEDATLTVNVGSTAAVPNGVFTTIKETIADVSSEASASPEAKKLAIAVLVKAFDAVVGKVDAADQASVVLEFSPAEAKNVKFHVDVTGYDATNPFFAIPVTADVYSDYHFEVALPTPGYDNLTASKATLNISMTGVESLGLKAGETRSYSKTVNTGVDGVSAKLSGYLENTYAFEGVTCPITIKDETGEKSFEYQIAGINDEYKIVGTPSSTEDARAAWKLMTSHVKASQDLSINDTHFLFKKGAYLQIGDERLVFLKDFDFLKGAASMETLFDGAQVRIQKANVSGANTVKAQVYLPAGSTLGVSSSAATVNEDVYVTMDGSAKATDANAVTGFFTKQKGGSQLNAKAAIAALVKYFDEVVGDVDNAEEVKFKVEFKAPKPVKFHVDVTGVDATDKTTPIAVNADVYDDYSFKVSLPDTYNENLSTSVATLNVSMTGVQSLGLKAGETRSYSKTVNTGLEGSAPLSKYLTNTYNFKGVTAPVTITDANDTKTFEYQIAGINEDYQIVGTPVTADGTNGTEAARAAWHLLTSHVKTQSGVTPEDTHFLFKKGAYIQVGNQKLVFVNDFDFLKGGALKDGASVKDLFANARVAQVEKEATAENSTLAEVYLPAGSTLGISNSAATVDQNVTVTMNGAKLAENGKIRNIFSLLQNSENLDAKVAIGALVFAFDAAVGEVDEAGNVSFTVKFSETEKPKFHVDVTGYDADTNDPIAVNADVYGDYHFVVALPFPGYDNLSASKATLNMSMTGVQSLGLGENETRSYSKTVNTGVDGVSAKLSGYLEKTYAFNGASCPVTIKDGNESKSFTYNIAGINDEYQIVGTPSDEQAARDAWHFMVNSNHVSASKVAADDTHFLFKKGAYLQIGDERLVFLDDFDFLKGAASMETLFDGANVRIEKANVSGANTAKAQVYLPAGSTLGVSSSAATAVEDVYVTMDAINKVSDANAVTGFFTNLKSGSQLNAKAAIAALVKYFDEVVGLVDQLDGVNFTVEFKQTENKPVKFHVDVTGEDYDTKAPIAVNADVYNDYSFKVSLPDVLNDNLSAGVATLNVRMTGVQSLGLGENETRSYSKTVNTGVVGVKAPLHSFLTNTYNFKGVTAPVTIKDGTESKSFTYNIAGIDENYNIIGTPSSTEDARAAWKFMVNSNHLKAAKTEKDDAHFLFKKGAYIQLGNEKLVFTKNFDFLKGSASLENLFEGAEIESENAADGNNKILSVYLPAGSTLALSTSAATVQKNVKITMDGAALADNERVKNVWSYLKDSENLNAKTAIAALIYAFDNAIGEVEKAEKVNFTVEFTDNNDVQYIDWNAADKTTWHNMVTDDDNAYNIDADNLYAFRVNSNQENVNINFTRKFTAGAWAAWVVPFDMTLTDDILENYEFGYIEGITANGNEIDKDDLGGNGASFGVKMLKAGQTVKANLPYVVKPKVTGSKTFTVENTTLKVTEPIIAKWTAFAYNYILTGVYETKLGNGELWYALQSSGSFKKAGTTPKTTLRPFRFFLTLTDNDNNPYEINAGALRLTIIDEATGINSIKTDGNGEMRIYDLQGRRVYNPTQKGVYIVNGRKVVMGR